MKVKIVIALAVCFAGSLALCQKLSLIESSPEAQVETDSAAYIGLLLRRHGSDNDAAATRGFFGVPYAQPPVGRLRFAPPLPWKPSHSNTPGDKPELLGNSSRPWCLQPSVSGSPPDSRMSEDCLYLNIQTPVLHQQNSSLKRPVFAWLHDGFLETGGVSGPEAPFGWQLVARQRLLLVEIGFRLGALGFLRLPGDGGGGNWGLLDQQMALSWISANIRAFGGDPGCVTLAGAGSGASAAGLHLFSRGSVRLFHRVALLGGGPLAPWLFVTDESAVAAVTDDFVDRASCRLANDSETLRCLRDADARALTALQPPAGRPLDSAAFPVVVDGSFITDSPASGSLADPKPAIVGVTDGEGDPLADRAIGDRDASDLTGQLYQDVLDGAFRFYPRLPHRISPTGRRLLSGRLTAFPSSSAARLNRQLLAHGLGLRHTVCPTNHFSDSLCNASAPAFVYQFTEPRVGGDAARHGDDAAYFTGEPLGDSSYGEAQQNLSSIMMSALSEFSQHGKISELTWPSASLAGLEFLHFSAAGPKPAAGGFNRQECQFWQNQLNWINSLDPSAGRSTEGMSSSPPDLESEFWARCNSSLNTISIVAFSLAGGLLLLLLCVSLCLAISACRSSRSAQVDHLRRDEAGASGSNVELARTPENRVLDVSRPGCRPNERVEGASNLRAQDRRKARFASRPGPRPRNK